MPILAVLVSKYNLSRQLTNLPKSQIFEQLQVPTQERDLQLTCVVSLWPKKELFLDYFN